ncbi:phosphate ABC transporter substrate-binding protein PstS [Glutamicibacter uratoxydans]|uniref:phosphate ABC transporter substrate-binding protein PstS n=1 Tax=Glutamicibacter uratoxydans TaxID=43667 RepID=UPI003D6DAD27
MAGAAAQSRPSRWPSRTRWALAVPALLLSTGLLAGCGNDYPLGDAQREAAENNTSSLNGTITGGGSTAQNAAMNAWTTSFSSVHPRVQVQYASVGSGAGRAGLLAGGTEFAGSDAYLKDEEVADSIARCGADGAINIPAYISPITVAFNLPGVSSLNFDADAVAKIFSGEITSWQDPAIAELNPGVELPDVPMTVVVRSDDSGTTENFTEYLHAAAEEHWGHEPSGSWPGGTRVEQAQGNSGVVTTVVRTAGAITYADDSLVDSSLGKAALKVGEGFVGVSGEAAALAVQDADRVEGRGPHDVSLHLNRTTETPGAYPLVMVSYFILCSSYEDSQRLELLKEFAHYVVSDAGQQAAADSAKSAPMPATLARDAAEAVDSITVRG